MIANKILYEMRTRRYPWFYVSRSKAAMENTPTLKVMPLRKRLFDIIVAFVMISILLPGFVLAAAAILILEGRPVLYKSWRRVYLQESRHILKFRTMRRNVDKILNRDTIPTNGVCFLNIPISSPAYTSIGRLIERSMLTEMPQLFHVLAGDMSVVGNRPLPENVVEALRIEQPNVDDRFLAPAGLTGPAQLVGRDWISDADRLRVEIAYCEGVLTAYSLLTDLKLLLLTVRVAILPSARFSPDEVVALLSPSSRARRDVVSMTEPAGRARRFTARSDTSADYDAIAPLDDTIKDTVTAAGLSPMSTHTGTSLIRCLLIPMLMLGWVTPARAAAEFVVGPGDRVAVAVFKRADLSGEFRVAPAGELSLPFVRSVPVAGLSLPQVQIALVQRLREDAYLLDPRVTVELVEARPISVAGDVSRPGSYSFVLGMTVMRAVAAAGGLHLLPADDVNVSLESEQIREKLRQAQQTLGLAIIRRTRLAAEQAGQEDFTVPDNVQLYLTADKAREAYDNEVALLNQRNGAIRSQLESEKEQLNGFQREIDALTDESAAKQQEASLAIDESSRLENLQRQGWAARDLRVNELQRLAAQMAAERSQIGVEIVRSHENIARISETMNGLANSRQIDLLTSIKESDDLISATQVSIDECRTALLQVHQGLPAPGSRFPSDHQAVFIVERTRDEAPTRVDADADTPVLPGDLVVVGAPGRFPR